VNQVHEMFPKPRVRILKPGSLPCEAAAFRTGPNEQRRRWCLDAAMSDPVELVMAYVEAAQRARTFGGQDDFEAIRSYLADEVEIRLASPWIDEPWRTAHTGADAVVDRLRSSANAGARLTTETVNAVTAGGDVLIEQVSTLHTDEGAKVSCVAHLFTVVDNRIARIRTYRNDAGLPTG
jgi:ketosteroid isomerase-like protein